MRTTSLLLGVSIAANAALVIFVFHPSGTKPPAFDELQSGSATEVSARGSTGSVADDRKDAPGKMWETLNQLSRVDMVARLRASGYPPSAIRALVHARLTDEMRERRRELMAGVEEVPYWQSGGSNFNPKVAAAQRRLYQEQMELMRELLGPDAIDDNEINQYHRRRQYGDISPEKAEELQRTASDYNEMRSEIYAATNGMLLPEDREKIAFLEREQRNDLANILTPQELEDYELRSSPASHTLRSQLITFQPTEAEFRGLFRAARSAEDQFGPMQGMISGEQMRQRQAAINESAKQFLSPERYAEFAQAMDPRYTMLNRMAERFALPPTVVPQIAAVQQDIQQRAAALAQVPAADRAVRLRALADEATEKLSPLLGDRAFEAYKTYGGQWLQTLTAGSATGSRTIITTPRAPFTKE